MRPFAAFVVGVVSGAVVIAVVVVKEIADGINKRNG